MAVREHRLISCWNSYEETLRSRAPSVAALDEDSARLLTQPLIQG